MITVPSAMSLVAKAPRPFFGERRTSKNSLMVTGAAEVNDRDVIIADREEELEAKEEEDEEEEAQEESVEDDGESSGDVVWVDFLRRATDSGGVRSNCFLKALLEIRGLAGHVAATLTPR